jgi:peptidoglycan/xylan/chitin deacetylase (PgdA/CDA1 family)
VKTSLNKKSLLGLSRLEIILSTLVVSLAGVLLSLVAHFIYVDSTSPPGVPLSPDSEISFVTPTPPQIDQFTVEPPPSAGGVRGGQLARSRDPGNHGAANPTPAPYFADANEMGKVMVLEYHRIAYPEMRYQRSPDNFRKDIQRLIDNDFYPVNFIDLVNGLDNVPPGKKPIVLTFDDSDSSQFWVMEDRTVDADSALGILLNFHEQYIDDWPIRGTFFILGDDTANYMKIFGQPEWSQQKLQVLVDLGMEIGSHTVNHVDLSQVAGERIEWELAVSQHIIEELVPGYEVQTLSVPYGGFPWNHDYFVSGTWGEYDYTYAGNAAAWGGPSVSPHDPEFNRYKVSRIEVSDIWADHWITYFEQNPHEYYVSDGDPNRLTYPQPDEQQIAAETTN